MLGEDEDWLHELAIDMFPEDGCLWVYGVGEDGVTAFTQYGVECLKQIIADERAAGNAPPPVKPTNSLPCGPHRMLTLNPPGEHARQLALPLVRRRRLFPP